MPTTEVNTAILKLELQLKNYEKQVDKSAVSKEIYTKTKVILRKLKDVSNDLYDLKKLQLKK
jgi:hypothetical protein